VCECGPSGSVLSRPHECPKMTRSRPDILRDTEVTDMINVMEKNKDTIPAMVEDPVRRIYKRILAVTFLATSLLYILVDLSFQIQSAVSNELAESTHEANLGTTLYILMFFQQIINPAIFLHSEFISK